MDDKQRQDDGSGLSRRRFLQSAAAASAGLALSRGAAVRAATRQAKPDDILVGLIGAGNEGKMLMNNCLKIPGVRFKAVCDIWPYKRDPVPKLLKRYGHEANAYEDYREMLAKEKDLDAVIVATPDWVHAEQTIAALKAGLHVYCEKEMSNTIENCRQMVLAARQAGKLLQIGHQRRSNPRYHVAMEYIDRVKALGRINHVQAHWNRLQPLRIDVKEVKAKLHLDEATLKRYGYDTMERLCNWRWYRKFSGGPIADLGSHQIDVFIWFLHAPPKAVMADGGQDNYPGLEWYDNVVALYEWDYEWEGKTSTVRGHYQLCSASSHGGYQEAFLGKDGSLVLSESMGQGFVRREEKVDPAAWEKDLTAAMGKMKASLRDQVAELQRKLQDAQKKLGKQAPAAKPADKPAGEDDEIKVGHTIPAPGRYYPPIPPPAVPTTEHGSHLVNFFDAIRKGTPLTCPGEVGYETAVAVLKVNEALATGRKIEFKPEDFKA